MLHLVTGDAYLCFLCASLMWHPPRVSRKWAISLHSAAYGWQVVPTLKQPLPEEQVNREPP